MIVSASYRTDVPAFYGAWFLGRLLSGQCRVANPYGGPDYLVALTPEAVDGFVFWTRTQPAEEPGAVKGRYVGPVAGRDDHSGPLPR